jgi:hypothetical protein
MAGALLSSLLPHAHSPAAARAMASIHAAIRKVRHIMVALSFQRKRRTGVGSESE